MVLLLPFLVVIAGVALTCKDFIAAAGGSASVASTACHLRRLTALLLLININGFMLSVLGGSSLRQ